MQAFSATVVRRSLAKRMTPDEIEEATLEGVALLYELHGVWKPARCPSFYDYCVTYLQFRLISWWRREVRQRNLAHKTGQKFVYHGRVSLDEFPSDGEDESREDRALVTQDTHRLGD